MRCQPFTIDIPLHENKYENIHISNHLHPKMVDRLYWSRTSVNGFGDRYNCHYTKSLEHASESF